MKSTSRTMQHHLKHISSRLVPLDKNPGWRLICVGKVLLIIAGKVVMSILKDDLAKAVGNLQLCDGQNAGCEAAVHLMLDIFATNETEAVLLVDAEKAFTSVNRQVSLHNIKEYGTKYSIQEWTK